MNLTPLHFSIYFGLAAVGLAGYAAILPSNILVWLAFSLVLAAIFDASDKSIPVARLAALIALSQWLLGAELQYGSNDDFGRYQMYVSKEVYFQYAIPGTCFYALCLIATAGAGREGESLRMRNRGQDFLVGLILLGISTAAMFVVSLGLVSGSVGFIFNLMFQFRYIAVLYFFFSGHRFRWILIAFSAATLFIYSGRSAMFHDLIIWLALYFFYFISLKPRTVFFKSVSFATAAFAVLTIQLAKGDYREKMASGIEPSFVESAYAMVITKGGLSNNDLRRSTISRLNQGWIISAVIRHVPEREPFANGETILDAVEAAILPRFLAPNKKGAGGRDNFMRFTGLPLGRTTSMATSPLGEAYANFGVDGGIFFMTAWGTFFGFLIRKVRAISIHYPSIIMWIPLFIYQAIKAETEFVVVFNQLSKGAILSFGTYFFLHHIFLKNASAIFGDGRDFEINRPRGGLADIQRH